MSSFRFGSHLPVLMEAVRRSQGPILELGSGIYSTVYLHWACFNNKRSLTTVESKRAYYLSVKNLRCDWHNIEYIKSWELAQSLYKQEWGVVLVDQGPGINRGPSAQQLTHADYVVLHDSDEESDSYGYEKIYPLFKYRFDYHPEENCTPGTTVLSNKHDLTDFLVRP